MTEKDKTFQDILSELQISNKGGFNQVFQLEGIQKSLLITEQATTTSKDDTKTQNDKMVARLNDLLDNSTKSLNCLTEILANASKKKTQRPTTKDKEIAAGLSYISNYTAANGVELIAIQEYLKKIEFSNEAIMMRVGALVDAAKGGSSLKDLENNKEMLEIFKKIQETLENITKPKNQNDDKEKPVSFLEKMFELGIAGFKKGITTMLLRASSAIGGFLLNSAVALGALLLGVVSGFSIEVAKQLKGVFTSLGKYLNISGFLKNLGGNKFIKPILDGIKFVFDFVKGIGGYFLQLYTKIKNYSAITKFFTFISNILSSIGSAFKTLTAGSGTSILSSLDDIIKPVKTFFSKFTGIAKKFFSFGKVIGNVLGKLALPITVIMSIFDFVMGAIDGFTKTEGSLIDKIIGGLKGGLTGLVNGLIGIPLNLLKSAVSWIAGALGFEGIEKALDSFSFTDIIKTAINGVVDTVVTFFTDQFAFLSSIFQGLKDLFSGEKDLKSIFLDVMAGLVKTLLAPVNAISKFLPFDLTKKALDLLGLPSSGGSGATGAAGAEQTKGKIDLKSGGSMVPVGPSGPLNRQQLDNGSDNVNFADDKIYKTAEQAETAASSSITAAPLGASEDPFGLKSLDGLNAAVSTIAQESPLSSPRVTDADMLDAYNQAALLDDTQDAVLNSDEELLNTYARTAQLERNDSPIVGAEMNALETDTAQTEDAYTNAANSAIISASSGGGGGSSSSRTINNDNKSVTYNSNNIPDRTSWMLTPQFY